MDETKVLITTSGIGARLGDLTKYTNKSLIRVGKKPAISYIIESYPKDTNFIITLGYKGDLVQQFLSLCYPNYNITYVHVDKYDGDGSSLLYSMSCAENWLKTPFIFHACDSIIEQKINTKFKKNWDMVSEDNTSDQIRCLGSFGNKVTKIFEKGELNYTLAHIGVVGIYDYEKFWNTTELILNQEKNNNQLSDVDVINKMIENNSEFNIIKTNNWLDIGNTESLNYARQNIKDKFENLDKIDQSVYVFDNKIIKFFNNSDDVKNRVERAKNLNNIVPKIIGKTNNFFAYEKAEGNIFSHGIVNSKNFTLFLEWCKNNLWNNIVNIDISKECYSFYYTKTIKRIDEFYKITGIKDKQEFINDECVPEIKDIIQQVNFKHLCEKNPIIVKTFHGDLHFENIIQTKTDFKLIDWRDTFGNNVSYGDIYYDLAKIQHGIFVSHDIIKANQFTINMQNNYIKYDILLKETLFECLDIFNKFINENNYNKYYIDILTYLIYLNISPLHHNPYNIFLYYFGKKRLYDIIKK